MNRRDKIGYYLDIAETVLTRGTCIRRNYGALIVKNDQIISTGYTGAPRGRANCINLGRCIREHLNIPRGERYELCRSVHAEQNAIIHASRPQMLDSTLYLVGKEFADNSYITGAEPCDLCKRFIINAGISLVTIRDNQNDFRSINVFDEWIMHDDSIKDLKTF